jgi:tetratricopeptide (TPR) repeat protein
MENALAAYVKYMCKTVLPHDLAVYYPFTLPIPLWQVVGSLLILLVLSVVAIRSGRHHPYFAVGWFWFLITLVPVIGLIQVGGQSMADRYTYIPVTGLFIMATWGIPDLVKGLRYRQGILALLAGIVISASAILTWQQLGYWQDNISLYRHSLEVTTGNYFIHANLGVALADKGDLNAAIQEYQEALRISSGLPEAHNNLGIAYYIKGNLDAAIQEFTYTLFLNPTFWDTHNKLGVALARKGNLDAALQEFQKEIKINPNNSDADKNLKLALDQKKISGE